MALKVVLVFQVEPLHVLFVKAWCFSHVFTGYIRDSLLVCGTTNTNWQFFSCIRLPKL